MLTPAELAARTATLLSPLPAAIDPWHTTGAAPLTLTYQFAGAAQPGDLGAQFTGWTDLNPAQRDAFRAALAAISEVANVSFVEVSGQADPDFNLGMAAIGANNGIGGFSVAYTTGGGGEVISKTWDGFVVVGNGTAVTYPGDAHLLLHEISHSLSLKHPGNYDAGGNLPPPPFLDAAEDNNKYSLMSYNGIPGSGVMSDSLMVYDIAALQQRWGAKLSTRAGNDVYTGGTGGQIKCVWDGGGIDLIDGSAVAGGAVIRLNSGEFSSVGATDNLIIAYGATIEDARGGAGADTITGNAAANTLRGGGGIDALSGQDGNDRLYADADGTSEVFVGGAGAADIYDVYYAASAVTVTFGAAAFTGAASGGGLGADTFTGVERIDGSLHGDYVYGAASAETVYARAGADRVYGGGGNDRIDGGADGDIWLSGEADADFITGGTGNDRIDGGTGDDTWLAGEAGSDTVTGNAGNDRIDGGADNDTWLAGDAGSDTVTGGAGNDRIDGGADNDAWLAGDAGIDLITGGLGNDRIEGGSEGDTLYGDDGADTITGGLGTDTLYGGAANDYMEGGASNDTMTGGAGLDTFDFNPGTGLDSVTDFVNDVDTIRIDGGFGFANVAAVLARTIQSGNHARILLNASGSDSVYLTNYLSPGSGNTIANLGDDILIA